MIHGRDVMNCSPEMIIDSVCFDFLMEFIYIGATMPVKATEDLFKPIMLATKGYRENGRKGIGLTPSNCSCQEVGGRSVLSNSICQINYPINWLYEIDETTRYIDTDKSRECTVPLDYQIPLTYELAQSLYDNWQTRDILLEYAIDYLKYAKFKYDIEMSYFR